MIDIHTHILYGVDDGARSLEESMTMIRSMCNLGFTKIVATPHYMDNTIYMADNKKKKEIIEELKEKIAEENLPIQIYLGNEIFLDEDIISKILSHDIYSLNGNNYLLIEVPMFERLARDIDILYDLIEKGARIVLAHPERYTFFQEDPSLLQKYLDMGILMQGNLDSYTGKYGTQAKKLFIQMLKNKQFYTLASDVHREDSKFFKHFAKVKKDILKITGEEYFNQLLSENPENILAGISS